MIGASPSLSLEDSHLVSSDEEVKKNGSFRL